MQSFRSYSKLFLPFFIINLCSINYAYSEPNGTAFIYDNMGSNSVVIATCDKFAGAICRLSFNGKQLVDNFDHGRQIQTAVFYPNSAFNADGSRMGSEAFAPTEAGSRVDGQGNNSTSLLQSIYSNADYLKTKIRPAYWLQPGESSPAGLGATGLNTSLVSNTIVEKEIKIGYSKNGVNIPHAIEINHKITLEPNLPNNVNYGNSQNSAGNKMTFEVIAAYLHKDLNKFYSFNEATGKLVLLSGNKHNSYEGAFVVSNQQGTVWLGLYTPDGSTYNQSNGDWQVNSKGYWHNYGMQYLDANTDLSSQRGLVKLNSVMRKMGGANEVHNFRHFLALAGSKQGIETVMSNLYQYVN
ncbi:hypothetical protein PN836_003080 [Ningiella sp. W23]|uniref:hypothetical protein n=1 Tax=Ningiella sp. W23 TaxID=3023715 RepID=UPI003757A0C8